MRNLILAAGAALILSACASAGTDFDWNRVAALKAGESRADVLAALGPPTEVTTSSDGVVILTWSHAHVGMLGGVSSKAVALKFKDGRLMAVPDLSAIR